MSEMEGGCLEGVGLAMVAGCGMGSRCSSLSKSEDSGSCLGVVCAVVVMCCRCVRNNRVVIVRGPVVV